MYLFSYNIKQAYNLEIELFRLYKKETKTSKIIFVGFYFFRIIFGFILENHLWVFFKKAGLSSLSCFHVSIRAHSW